MNALIIGGSRGIGAATAKLLASSGWLVMPYGSADYDVVVKTTSDLWRLFSDADRVGKYDALIYCAGSIVLQGVYQFSYAMSFYQLIAEYGPRILNDGAAAIAISSVAAGRPARQNQDYAASKAALESYALTLAYSQQAIDRRWRIGTIRFDLVKTDMYKQLVDPVGNLISAEEAAEKIVEIIHNAR